VTRSPREKINMHQCNILRWKDPKGMHGTYPNSEDSTTLMLRVTAGKFAGFYHFIMESQWVPELLTFYQRNCSLFFCSRKLASDDNQNMISCNAFYLDFAACDRHLMTILIRLG
jgi:hypothetical protein